MEYFHVVFTLPHEFNHLAMYNQTLFYNLLFKAAWIAISTLGKDSKRLNGEMGMLSILHTWGQNLSQHIHLHCVVPGGALQHRGQINKAKWCSCKPGFLFPIKVMSKIFRGTYIHLLKEAFKNNQIKLTGPLANLSSPPIFTQLIDQLALKDWIVYAKKPFAGPEQVLNYLGRYTHKIAITNHRLVSCVDGKVKFYWRDYAHANVTKIMTLTANEFIRRFLMHVIPHGFMRIRFFGFLANSCKSKKTDLIRQLLFCKLPEKITSSMDIKSLMSKLTGIDITVCPICKQGHLHNSGCIYLFNQYKSVASLDTS